MIARRHLLGLLAGSAAMAAGPVRASFTAGIETNPCRQRIEPFASDAGSFLALYAQNRAEGRPNLITEALIVQMLGLSLRRAQRQFERQTLAPLFAEWLTTVAANLPANAADSQAGQLLGVVIALLQGTTPTNRRAKADVERARAAAGIARSAVLGIELDFSQMKPRGHYADDEALSRLFQAMRYAGLAPLLLNPSPATGVNDRMAREFAATALALSTAMQAGAAADLTRRIHDQMAASFGAADDFSALDLPVAATDPEVLRATWLATANSDRLPGVIDVVMDNRRLGSLTPAQAAISWRIMPGRRLGDVAAMQKLVAPHAGDAINSGATSFAAGIIDGRTQRAYVSLDDVRLLFGLGARPDAAEWKFVNMEPAAKAAWQELLRPSLPTDHLRRFLLKAGHNATSDRIDALLGAYVHYRHGLAMVAKQSMTSSPKGLVMAQARPGAMLDTDPAFLDAVAELARAHASRFPDPLWDNWQTILGQLGDIALRRAHVCTGEADDRVLNNLDLALAALIDPADDVPLAVDIHTVPSERRVTQIGIGQPRAIKAGNAVGADFRLYQWKQPMDARLTDRDFAVWLATDAAAAAVYSAEPSKDR